MIIFKAHRGWTYTLEYWTDEETLPDCWMTQIQWYAFDREKCIQAGQCETLSEAEKKAKHAIDWRVPHDSH